MTNSGVLLRGLGWDGRRCGTAENLVKFSEDLREFGGGGGRGHASKSWKEAIGLVDGDKLCQAGRGKRIDGGHDT